MIVAAEILTPVVGFVVGEDRDRALHQDLGVHFAAEAVSAGRGRADGQDYAVFGEARDGGETPVEPRTHQKPSAYRELVEGYLCFGDIHCVEKRQSDLTADEADNAE